MFLGTFVALFKIQVQIKKITQIFGLYYTQEGAAREKCINTLSKSAYIFSALYIIVTIMKFHIFIINLFNIECT